MLTNNYGLPESLVSAIAQAERDYSGPRNEVKRISCTTLISPPRIFFLRQRHSHELTEDAADRIWSLMGTLIHGLLEKSDDTNVLVEERQERAMDGVIVSGQADRITNDGSLEDYKFTTMWSVIGKPGGKPEWINQLNVLNWIFYPIFKIKRLVVHAILRDWSRGQHRRNPANIPPVQYKKIEVKDFWPIEKAAAYVRDRISLFKSCWPLTDEDLPACTDAEVWAKPDTWAVMKPGRKSAVAVQETEAGAQAKCAPGCVVVKRPGGRTRCENYCNVNTFCNIYKASRLGGYNGYIGDEQG